MKHGSLFSGIGGFDLAAEWMGWNNVFHCEWNPFGQRILKHYWPKAISYADITKTDFSIHRGTIDILTGGFPCQPYSQAGKRLGKEDDRHLWPEMLRAIREIQPGWVVGENVLGLVNWNGGLVFDEVQAELEAQGYEVQPFVLPACAVNAPHRRDRIWFVAYSKSFENQRRGQGGFHANFTGINAQRLAANPQNIGQEQSGTARKRRTGFKNSDFGNGINQYPNGERCDQFNDATEPDGAGFNSRGYFTNWHNWPTQCPVCDGDDGLFTESLRRRIREDSMGYLSEKEIDKILSKAHTEWRNESIKGGGNAIVPQVAYQIFQAIQTYHQTV